MECFKVVKNIKGELFSCLVPYGKARIAYKPGKVAKPLPEMLEKKYGICTFKTLRQAENFVQESIVGGVEIWKVEGVEPIRKLPLKYDYDELGKRTVESLLEFISHGFCIFSEWPAGTRMFKQVILKEKIG